MAKKKNKALKQIGTNPKEMKTADYNERYVGVTCEITDAHYALNDYGGKAKQYGYNVFATLEFTPTEVDMKPNRVDYRVDDASNIQPSTDQSTPTFVPPSDGGSWPEDASKTKGEFLVSSDQTREAQAKTKWWYFGQQAIEAGMVNEDFKYSVVETYVGMIVVPRMVPGPTIDGENKPVFAIGEIISKPGKGTKKTRKNKGSSKAFSKNFKKAVVKILQDSDEGSMDRTALAMDVGRVDTFSSTEKRDAMELVMDDGMKDSKFWTVDGSRVALA